MKRINLKTLCCLLPLFSNLGFNTVINEQNIFNDELKVIASSSIRDSENYYLKVMAKFPASYCKNNYSFGFISTSLLNIKEKEGFVLSNQDVINHVVTNDEYIQDEDTIIIASYLKIEKEDLTTNYAVRSYIKIDDLTYYSQDYTIFNYYRICEKIEYVNDDKESILNYAKTAKEINDSGLEFEFDASKSSYKVVGFNDNALENTIIPTYYKGYPVDEISENAFTNNKIIKTLQIPNSLTYIKKDAFNNANLTIYMENKVFKDTWDSDFNPSHCPIYFDIKSRRGHQEYISDENRIKTETYIHQLISEGSKAFNQENYPIMKVHYSDAVMISGLLDLYEVNNDPYYLNSAVNHMSNFINLNKGTWKYTPSDGQLDSIPIGDTLLRLANLTGNQTYQSLTKNVQNILNKMGRINCEGNNFYHKSTYPNQIWLDGLYMAMPFYSRYETELNNHKNYEDIYKQYKYIYDVMRNVDNGLYYHGYDFSGLQSWSKKNETNPKCSLSFWGRAIGWLVVSLANVIDNTEVTTENEYLYKSFLENMLKESIENVYKYVDVETNLFYQVVDRQSEEDKKKNYLETSASSLICFATLKANRLGILSEEYYLKGLATFNGLIDNKLEYDSKADRYVLKDINKVAGLSADRNGTFEYYLSEEVVNDNAKGSGPFLMAYSELIR